MLTFTRISDLKATEVDAGVICKLGGVNKIIKGVYTTGYKRTYTVEDHKGTVLPVDTFAEVKKLLGIYYF